MKHNYLKLFIIPVFFLIALTACDNEKEKDGGEMQFEESKVSIEVGEERELKLKNNGSLNTSELQWNSSDAHVVAVNNEGIIKGENSGTAVISVEYGSSNAKILVKVSGGGASLSLEQLSQPLSNKIIFSKDVELKAPLRVVQSFDFDSKGNIYYAQIGAKNGDRPGKTENHKLYILKGVPNQKPREYMTLKYFGHGTQIAVEESDGEVYIWVGSNGTKHSSKEYGSNPSFSRIKFEPGKEYEGYGGDTYFLNNGISNSHAAIDKEADLMCVINSKSSKRYVYTYRLSDATSLPKTDFDVEVTVGGEEIGETEQTIKRTVHGRDLSKLVPIGNFEISKGVNKEKDINSALYQGYDIDSNANIYFYEGEGGKASEGKSSFAYVTVFDVHGKIVKKRTAVAAITKVSDLEEFGITNSDGFMEAEGLKVKNESLFLEFGARNGPENHRKANIFKYEGAIK